MDCRICSSEKLVRVKYEVTLKGIFIKKIGRKKRKKGEFDHGSTAMEW